MSAYKPEIQTADSLLFPRYAGGLVDKLTSRALNILQRVTAVVQSVVSAAFHHAVGAIGSLREDVSSASLRIESQTSISN